MPLTSTCLIISNFALRRIPGFYSKDLILEILTNSMAYGTWRFNAAFTRALQ